MGSITQVNGAAGANICGTQAAGWVEDVDSDLLQEQTQSICEELLRRGACTTLALARHLGFEKSSAINPLMFLLLEKNVVVRVSDIPPIWSLSPTFPMSPHFSGKQFPLSPQPPSPLTPGFPQSVSPVTSTFRCSPMLPDPVPASRSSALGSVITSPASPAPSPPSTLTSSPALATPAPALIATPVVIPHPSSSPALTPISTLASFIPTFTLTATPTAAVSSPASTPISTPASVIPALARTAAGVVTPSLAPSPDLSKLPTTDFIVSRTALTFMEHVIPFTEEESEDNDEEDRDDEVGEEVTVVKTSPKTPLPALTFTEHLIPETTEGNKVSFVADDPPHIRPRLPAPALSFKQHVIPTSPPHGAVFHDHRKHEHQRNSRHNRSRKRESGQSYRYFHPPVENEHQGSNTPHKRQKMGDNLTELQLRILHILREVGPMKTIDLCKSLGLATSGDVNPALYDLQNKNLVVKISEIPVIWKLCVSVPYGPDPEEDHGCSDSDESW